MTRPLLEVADIVRSQGDRFMQHNFRWIHWAHRKVLRAIARCRTASLGGHRDQCPRCGYRTISYNSCRDRHCPKCQSGARDKWIMARQSELLPVAYVPSGQPPLLGAGPLRTGLESFPSSGSSIQ
jgi:hypothetical protein